MTQKRVIIDSQDALDALLKNVHQQIEPLSAALNDAIELLEDAMHQGCYHITEGDGHLAELRGYLDTQALSTWVGVGDYLVQHAGWERHPIGIGRRQYYRPPQTEGES